MELLSGLLPPGLPGVVAAVLVFASFFTSALTAAFGIGGGLAMLALMGLFLPVGVLIPVHGLVQLGSNAGRAMHQRAFVRWTSVMWFGLGSLAGALAGAATVVTLPDNLLKALLAIFVIAITWLRLPPLDGRAATVMALGGAVTTWLAMFLGATGPLVAALFGQAFDDRRVVVSTTAVAMTGQHLLKAAVFGALGFAFAPWLPLVIAMIATGYLGTMSGTRLLGRLPEASFRFWFRILLTMLALDMLRRAAPDVIALF